MNRYRCVLSICILAVCSWGWSAASAEESLNPPKLLAQAAAPSEGKIQPKALQSPRKFHDPKSQRSRQVVIYYANETAPTGPERAAYDHVIQVLEKAADPMVQSLALGFKMDPVVFPYSVDLEVHQLEQAVQFSGYRDASAMIVFTNRLAKRGRALAVDPRQIEPTAEVEFPLPSLETDVAKANPLAGASSLEAALRVTVQRFPADTYEYVLILKSHASPGFLVTPRLRLHAGTVPEEKLLETFTEIANQVKDSVAQGQPLLTEGNVFLDQEGKRLLHSGSRIVHESRGTLLIRTDTLGVIDGRGTPVLTNDGQPLTLVNGQITSPDGSALLLAQDQPVECRPKLPLRNPPVTTMELDLRRVRSIEVTPRGDGSERNGTALVPSAGEPHKAAKGDSLNGIDNSTLAKYMSGDFLSGFDVNQSGEKSVAEGVGVGITREAFSELLSRVTKDTGMYFPLVFLESCHSNLPESAFQRLELSEGVGIIWTSDPAGLNFRTVNYGKLDTIAVTYPQVSGGLNALLWEAYREQHPQP